MGTLALHQSCPDHTSPALSALDIRGRHTMDFGITVATAADSWKIVKRGEALGFTHAWFYDTQILNADPFVAMAAAPLHTRTIHLGTGVLVPSNRLAPVTA